MTRVGTNCKYFLFSFILILLNSVIPCLGGIIFTGCDKSGWKCYKSKIRTGKYDVEFDCRGDTAVSFALWNFRAPVDIWTIKIGNCSYLELDLTCSSEGKSIDTLHVYNVTLFNLTSPIHNELAFIPNKVIFENIDFIPEISANTFRQKDYLASSLYKCVFQTHPVDSIWFKNISMINKIKTNAFQMTDVNFFSWENITVAEIEPFAVKVFMAKEKKFVITNSSIEKISYQSFNIRSHTIFINSSNIKSIEKYGFSAVVHQFDFINNQLEVINSNAFNFLAQTVNLCNNSFYHLEHNAFASIGPGLLENALVSFGRLKFSYDFSQNKILLANVGSLHPDWNSYQNVKSDVNFTFNSLPCSCTDLGWITLEDGLGKELSELTSFNAKILDKKSQNFCIGAPCLVPLSVMSVMGLLNGTCATPYSMREICNKLNNDRSFRSMIFSRQEDWTSKTAKVKSADTVSQNVVLAEKLTEYVNDSPKEIKVLNIPPFDRFSNLTLLNLDLPTTTFEEVIEPKDNQTGTIIQKVFNLTESNKTQRVERSVDIFNKGLLSEDASVFIASKGLETNLISNLENNHSKTKVSIEMKPSNISYENISENSTEIQVNKTLTDTIHV